jgi:hypothetical protein
MIRRFGTAKIDKIKNHVGERISPSKIPLKPLKMFLIPISKDTKTYTKDNISISPPNRLVG